MKCKKIELLTKLAGIRKPEIREGIKLRLVYGKSLGEAIAEAGIGYRSTLSNAIKRIEEVEKIHNELKLLDSKMQKNN